MAFIKENIVPIKYVRDEKNKRDIFYFEALDEITSNDKIKTFDESFLFVKEIDQEDEKNGYFFSYKIVWEDKKNVYENCESDILIKLVKYLHKRLKNNSIVFGIPLKIKVGKKSIKKIPYDAKNFLDGTPLETKVFACSSKSPVLTHLNVGHGLSIYDSTNKILFDCGGSIDQLSYIEKLKNIIGEDTFSIIITHCHEDHYGYLKDVLEEFNNRVEYVITNNFFHKTTKLKDVLDGTSHKYIKENKIASIKNWDLYTRKRYSNQNLNSIICHNGKALITGDQSYFGVKDKISKNIDLVTEIQLPHHGGAKGQTGNPKLIPNKNIEKAIWSSDRTIYYPNREVLKHFKGSCLKAEE